MVNCLNKNTFCKILLSNGPYKVISDDSLLFFYYYVMYYWKCQYHSSLIVIRKL